MTNRDALLQAANARQQQDQLPYYGALTPQQAYDLLMADPAAVLVDVRTQAELDWVGGPDVPEHQSLHVEWSGYPGGAQNPRFDARVFCERERALIASDATQRVRWVLWAAKEAAYKAAKKLDRATVWAPARFEVTLEAQGRGSVAQIGRAHV